MHGGKAKAGDKKSMWIFFFFYFDLFLERNRSLSHFAIPWSLGDSWLRFFLNCGQYSRILNKNVQSICCLNAIRGRKIEWDEEDVIFRVHNRGKFVECYFSCMLFFKKELYNHRDFYIINNSMHSIINNPCICFRNWYIWQIHWNFRALFVDTLIERCCNT